MSFRVDPRISEEAAAKWQLALDRIEEESDQRLRSNLEVVLRHVEAEYLGDISTIMGTMAPYPRHEYVGIDKESPVGYEAVKAVYEAENKKGHRIFEAIESLSSPASGLTRLLWSSKAWPMRPARESASTRKVLVAGN